MSGIAILHLDESCLGNGREGDNPGGGGGLIEARSRKGRSSAATSTSAPRPRPTTGWRSPARIAALQLLARKGVRLKVLIVSDSQYLVHGMREWVSGWSARGWRRKEGAIENLELWQALLASSRLHDVQWIWVRGHKGHAKNEYANDLAVKAAREQTTSEGMVPSGFDAWLSAGRAKGAYLAYDPDEAFAGLERRLAGEELLPLSEEG